MISDFRLSLSIFFVGATFFVQRMAAESGSASAMQPNATATEIAAVAMAAVSFPGANANGATYIYETPPRTKQKSNTLSTRNTEIAHVVTHGQWAHNVCSDGPDVADAAAAAAADVLTSPESNSSEAAFKRRLLKTLEKTPSSAPSWYTVDGVLTPGKANAVNFMSTTPPPKRPRPPLTMREDQHATSTPRIVKSQTRIVHTPRKWTQAFQARVLRIIGSRSGSTRRRCHPQSRAAESCLQPVELRFPPMDEQMTG